MSKLDRASKPVMNWICRPASRATDQAECFVEHSYTAACYDSPYWDRRSWPLMIGELAWSTQGRKVREISIVLSDPRPHETPDGSDAVVPGSRVV
ncbi:unnamed protein product [Aspergillus luchuensis]|uniref:Unnamed protein product n=1 Tax=Aspergillus kawachii TaxID=1069201 RepID=A0A146FDE6_ASPKA|nr:unnamed protein product [Aspergillus luchuensis]